MMRAGLLIARISIRTTLPLLRRVIRGMLYYAN
jgi:hypothetical protein